MKQHIFCVMDTKTNYFNLPFFQPTVPSGQRLFRNLASDGQSLISRFPADFVLFQIGEFDDELGVVTPCNPINLGSAVDYKD